MDGTGLYYYGARYYDPLIGRFISPDPTIPDTQNPQAFGRYAYCINNPLKYADPLGLDYIIVGGSGSSADDAWFEDLARELGWNEYSGEQLFVIPDVLASGILNFEVFDQYLWLINELGIEGKYTDIKLIGHSEGAATIAKFLSTLADDDSFLANTNVRDELSAAILLDCPTGLAADFVTGWDDAALVNLPDRLEQAKIDITLAMIHSSWIGSSIPEGWEDHSHYVPVSGFWIWTQHSRIKSHPDAIRKMQEVLGIAESPVDNSPGIDRWWDTFS